MNEKVTAAEESGVIEYGKRAVVVSTSTQTQVMYIDTDSEQPT